MNITTEYRDAAKRQRQIAEYFFGQLEVHYDPSTFEKNSIKTQAYFEGCIKAAYSCLDKLCEGKLKADKNKEEASIKKALVKYSLTNISSEYAFVNQLRKLRNDVTHNKTKKSSDSGNPIIEVYINDGTNLGDIKELAKRALDLTEKTIGEAHHDAAA